MNYLAENEILVENIRRLCRNAGISLTILEERLGFGNGAIGKWAKSQKRPNHERVVAVASFFGETIDSLRQNAEETKKEPTTPKGSELDDLDIQIMKIVRNLGQGEKQTLLAGLRTTIANRGSNQ